MIRKIIQIDENKCNGCGLCVDACHEGAISMANGKAKLMRDDYCDGLDDCLPICPTGAITFEQREAAEYDEAAVKANMKKHGKTPHMGGCPGSNAHTIKKAVETSAPLSGDELLSELNQWPVQIRLIPVNASYFNGSNLLIAADCTAFAYGDFHRRFMKNKITLIGCPKLDDCDYSEKLGAILTENDIKSITVIRMEVPCCGGIVSSVENALRSSGKMIPWQIVTVSTDGQIIDA